MKLHLLAALLVPAVASVAAEGVATPQPSPASVARANQTTQALAGGLVAAVVSISDATPPGTSAEDVAANSAAISPFIRRTVPKSSECDASTRNITV